MEGGGKCLLNLPWTYHLPSTGKHCWELRLTQIVPLMSGRPAACPWPSFLALGHSSPHPPTNMLIKSYVLIYIYFLSFNPHKILKCKDYSCPSLQIRKQRCLRGLTSGEIRTWASASLYNVVPSYPHTPQNSTSDHWSEESPRPNAELELAQQAHTRGRAAPGVEFMQLSIWQRETHHAWVLAHFWAYVFGENYLCGFCFWYPFKIWHLTSIPTSWIPWVGVVGWMMPPPPQYVLILIPRTCEYHLIWQKVQLNEQSWEVGLILGYLSRP